MAGVLSIGEFARATGLTAKALRLYDELELLKPAEVDQNNGYRYYLPDQVDQARLVARLRSAEVPLQRIAAIIGAATPEAAADEVLSYWRQVEADRASAREVIGSLVALLRGQDNTMTTTPDVKLADLIAGIYENLPDADQLARITEARRRAQALTDLGEQLVEHYVTEAKQSGASWEDINAAFGETGGASRPRHAPNAFERFTNLNRHSIVLAQEAARAHQNDAIGTEHMLLGLLDEPKGLAHVLLAPDAEAEQSLRDAINGAMPPSGESMPVGHIPFRPESKDAIEEALRASSELGHDWVGTEHVLLGLMRVEDSVSARILGELGFTAEGLREAVVAAAAEGRD